MTIASVETWVLIFIALGIMQASPGPAVLTLIAYSLEFGRTLAVSLFVAFVLGQFTALAVGVMSLAVLLSKAPEAIGVLRFTGGCMLLFVGATALVRKLAPALQHESDSLKEIEYSPLLTVEEEKRYTSLAKIGDENARAKMVKHNLPLLVEYARCYSNRGLTHLDLIKEGYHALILSIEKYDPKGAISFSTHTAWLIRQTLECELLMNHSREIHQRSAAILAEDTPAASVMQLDNIYSDWKLHRDNCRMKINNWLMSVEPKHHNIVASYFGLDDYEARKDIRHTSPVAERSRIYAVANTWFIAASSPIAIVFYTAVIPDFVDLAGLDSGSFVFLGSAVLCISILTGAFYILAACFARTMVASSVIGKWIGVLANVVLVLAGVWVITSVIPIL